MNAAWRIAHPLAAAMLWGTAVYGALTWLPHASLDEHAVCGPWGCGPPASALLTVHAGWAVALLPPMLYLPWRCGLADRTCCRIGLGIFLLAVAGLSAIVLWQWLVWLPAAGAHAGQYIWQRCGFVILTAVDWPLVILAIGGSLIWQLGRARRAGSNV